MSKGREIDEICVGQRNADEETSVVSQELERILPAIATTATAGDPSTTLLAMQTIPTGIRHLFFSEQIHFSQF